MTDSQDWAAVGRWVDERTRVWTSTDLARHGIDKKTLDKVRSGEKVRADARRRISLALGLGDGGLDAMARGDSVTPSMDDTSRRLDALEARLARVESRLEERLER